MALGIAQPLAEMSTRKRKQNGSGCRARMARKADNPTATCEPTIYTIWDPQHLTTLWSSTACYGDRITFLYVDDVRTSEETHL
jgi:hypothetical protein